jgi:tetratricopeptide (TPR) repeat protein
MTPSESRNRAFRDSGVAFGHNIPSNSSRPATPVHNQDRLHPDFPITPPRSRPRSLNDLNRIRELEAENTLLKDQVQRQTRKFQELRRDHDRLTQELNDYKEDTRKIREERIDHAAANRKILELESQVSRDIATIESVRDLAASLLSQLGQYSSAADQYQQLSSLKRDERRLKARQNDARGRRKAADREAHYLFLRGTALADGEDWENAERVFNQVLQTLPTQHSSSDTPSAVDARDVKVRLCKVLHRLDKPADAIKIYLEGANPLLQGQLNIIGQQSSTWALQNGMSLAHLLIKERRYRDGMYWLEKVWQNRHTATPDGLGDLEEEVMQIMTIMDSRGDSDDLFKLLAMVCNENDEDALSEPTLYYNAKLGLLYHTRHTSGLSAAVAAQYHTRAIACLHRAWAQRHELCAGAINSGINPVDVGWALALSSVYLEHYQTAKDVLHGMPDMIVDDMTDGGPSKDCILALLAHTHLKLGEYTAAESTAYRVFVRSGVKNVFVALESPFTFNSFFSKFHQADTLIQARSMQKSADRFKLAHSVWSVVYKARENIYAAGEDGQVQLWEHGESGKVLESEWSAFAKTRSKSGVKVPSSLRSEVEWVVKKFKR